MKKKKNQKTEQIMTMGFKPGTTRDYSPYGIYMKSEDGRWVRQKSGYPEFRRTKAFKQVKDFLLSKGEKEDFINRFNTKSLKSILRKRGLLKEFENGKKI